MAARLPADLTAPDALKDALLAMLRDAGDAPDPEAVRANALEVIREAYDHARGLIRAQFLESGDSKKALRQATALIDRLISVLFDFAGDHLFRIKGQHVTYHMAVVAVGGYGREELFPYSDVDVLFLHDGEEWNEVRQVAEFILYILWDLGVQVGQTVSSIDELLQLTESDYTVRTNLLDARFVCGNHELQYRFREQFRADVATEPSVPAFVEAKLTERDARHKRCGDSRYVLEPNVKEGKGGLRDIHMLYWLGRYVYRIRSTRDLVKRGILRPEEHRAYIRCLRFLSKIRIHLHLEAERAEERLTFDMQRVLAERMGYRDRGSVLGVERFMKAYFLTAKTVGSLTHVFCAVLEEEHKSRRLNPFPALFYNSLRMGGFVLEAGRLAAPHDEFFYEKPSRMVKIFTTAQEHGLNIHPRTLRLITRQLKLVDASLRADHEANDAFMQILTSTKQPEVTLRRMNDAGVLGRFIPDFGRVMGQMQYDMYHVYTVDEHTIFAIGILAQIARGERREEFPLTSELIHRVPSPRVLALSVLCHDIAKGREGDHSILGEKVALRLAKRFGFDQAEAELTAWLVRYHLLFSHTAFKRDIAEEKTVADFVAKVQSPERLRLLLLLTVVDIRAVGPKVWNSWKGALLRELFYRAEMHMGAADPSVKRYGEKMLEDFRDAMPDWDAQARAAYLALGNAHFFSALTAQTHGRVARLVRQLEADDAQALALDVEVDEPHAITEVLLVTRDDRGLFALVTGALTAIGANIVNAKVFTLKNGLAVEQYMVQGTQGKAYDRHDKWDNFTQMIADHREAGTLPDIPMPARRKSRYDVFTVPPRINIDNTVSAQHTVIEVNGRDRPGFLHRITHALAELGLSIATAHITSYGERAVDVFYVKDVFGMKVISESKLRQIHDRLHAALTHDMMESQPKMRASR